MFFSTNQRAVAWVLLGLVALLAIAWIESNQTRFVSSFYELQQLPLPAKVTFNASIMSVRASGPALIFELENQGKLTCYWRKPPSLQFFFPHERVRVEGKVERTPKGKLCVVESLVHITP